MIEEHLNNIAENMLLVKLQIIPKFILTETELNKIEKFLSNQNLEILSNEHIYELLTMQTKINETDIIFSIRVPVLEPTEYQLHRVIPVPINKTQKYLDLLRGII